MRILLYTFLLLVNSILQGQNYACPGGDVIELKNLITSSSGPGCLIELELEIAAVNFGNWSWSAGGSAGGFFLSSSTDPIPVNIGPFYINKSCGNLAGESAVLSHVASGTDCAAIPLATLPIHLLSFNVFRERNNWKAVWRALSESESESFDLQISNDAAEWKTIFSIGADPTKTEYAAILPDQGEGLFYVRLKMYDADGRYNFSPIRSIPGTRKQIKVYPTLVTASEKVDIEGLEELPQIQLLTTAGEILWASEAPMRDFTIPDNIIPGLYLVKILTRESKVFKILVY